MIAVIFEVVPYMGERHKYLDLAGELRTAAGDLVATATATARIVTTTR